MDANTLLRKLRPLLPDRVRTWQRALDLAPAEVRVLVEKEIITTAHAQLGEFRHTPLLSLPPRRVARGPIRLGTILYGTERWPAGITHAELLQHLAIFGRSGAGKTNVTLHVLTQLIAQRIPFVFLDWKRTVRHLIPQLTRRVHVYTAGRELAPLPFHPFTPPPNLEPKVYATHVVDVMARAYTLGDGARSVLQHSLCALYQHNTSPTIAAVLASVRAIPDTERVRGWKITAIRALESLARIGTPPPTTSQTAMATALMRQSTVIELDGLAPSNKQFLLPLLCLWLYYTKLPTPTREQLTLVIIVEEAHHLFYTQRNQHETLMEMLLRQCREIGIGMLLIDQHPHLMSSATLGNTYTSICLNLKDPKDLTKAAALSLLPPEDRTHLSTLPTGEGIVKLQDRWHHPFLVRFPHLPLNKGAVTDTKLRAYLRRSTALNTLKQPTPTPTPAVLAKPHAAALLHDVARYPDAGVDERYRRLSLSTHTGHNTKQHLLAQKLINEQPLTIGNTRKKLLRLTTHGRKVLGTTNTSTGASLTHDYWQRHYQHHYEKRGYTVIVEAPRRHGTMDLLATKGHERIAIEIETGNSNVAHNVRQDLLAGCTHVAIIATDTQALRTIERQLGTAGLLLDRVSIIRQRGSSTQPSALLLNNSHDCE